MCSLSISLFSGPNIHYSRNLLCSKFKWTYCSNLWSQPSISGNDCLLRQWQTCGNCNPIVLLIIPAVRLECLRQALVSLPKLSLENASSFPKITWSSEVCENEVLPEATLLTVRWYCLQWLSTAELAFDSFHIYRPSDSFIQAPRQHWGWQYF